MKKHYLIICLFLSSSSIFAQSSINKIVNTDTIPYAIVYVYRQSLKWLFKQKSFVNFKEWQKVLRKTLKKNILIQL